MAELSRPDQIPALKAIWAASFPEDSPELIDRAFGRLYRPADCMVECRAGRPVSMAFLLPAVWHNGPCTYPVQYIYAAATCRLTGVRAFSALCFARPMRKRPAGDKRLPFSAPASRR